MTSLLSAIGLISSFVLQQPPPQIRTGLIKEFVGKTAEVCGRVVTYRCRTASGLTHLSLDKPYWEPGVVVGIRTAQRPEFGERFEEQYLNQDVCATGQIERLDDGYLLIVETPAAVTVMTQKPLDVPVFAADAVQNCSIDVQPPKLLLDVKPSYTAEAMRAKVHGTVLMDAVVRLDGRVGDTRVVYSLDPGLDGEAIRAVRQWRFAPGSVTGRMVPMIVQIELTFALK